MEEFKENKEKKVVFKTDDFVNGLDIKIEDIKNLELEGSYDDLKRVEESFSILKQHLPNILKLFKERIKEKNIDDNKKDTKDDTFNFKIYPDIGRESYILDNAIRISVCDKNNSEKCFEIVIDEKDWEKFGI